MTALPNIPLAETYGDAMISGAARDVLARDEDAEINASDVCYLHVDGDDPNWNPQTGLGADLTDGAPVFSGDTTVTVAADAAFNNQKAYTFTGSTHNLRVRDGKRRAIPNLRSFDMWGVHSMPQSQLDLADAFNLGAYLVSIYDEVLNQHIGGIQVFGANLSKGFQIDPGPHGVSGNPLNVLWPGSTTSGPTFPQARPTALVPFLWWWQLDTDPVTGIPVSQFYLNDMAAPITSKVHQQGDLGNEGAPANGRYWLGSFAPNSAAGWVGKARTLICVMDRSNPATAITPATRIVIGNKKKAISGIP